MWPDRRLLDLFDIEFPIMLAPMAGVMDAELAIAAAQGGALASLPCAMLSADKAREQVGIFRQQVTAPINLNFFCHQAGRRRSRRARPAGGSGSAPIIEEFGLDPAMPVAGREPRAVRRGDVRAGRGAEARGGELSFRPAGGARCSSASRRPAAT